MSWTPPPPPSPVFCECLPLWAIFSERCLWVVILVIQGNCSCLMIPRTHMSISQRQYATRLPLSQHPLALATEQIVISIVVLFNWAGYDIRCSLTPHSITHVYDQGVRDMMGILCVLWIPHLVFPLIPTCEELFRLWDKYTDSGIWKENAQRLNLSCLTEAVMPEVKVEAWCIVKNGTSHHLTNLTSCR